MSEQNQLVNQVTIQSTQTKKRLNGKKEISNVNRNDFYFKVAIPKTIFKRDGRIVPFDAERIENALVRCFVSLGQEPKTSTHELTQQIVNVVAAKYAQPTVEGVQDIVEMVLQAAGEYDAAKHYILYRAEHAKMRTHRPIPDEVRDAFAASDNYFPTQLQKFQFYDKYSRFNYDLGRRETWLETVERAVDFLRELSHSALPAETYERIRLGILNMEAMPSMRLLAMAGPAARRNNVAIYNCSYLPVESMDAFVEALIISMSGCGVGYSVERQYVENFPRVRRQTGGPLRQYMIEDSSEGWADALRVGLHTWFEGEDIQFDYSQVRPAGAALLTKGGRASGPAPLRKMMEFARSRILARQGSFLRPIDAHDMMCAVGSAAVSGGVRRTAMLSLFDYDDSEMRLSKSGDFSRNNSQRWNANNSAVWPSRELTQAEVARYILEMVESERGEPGIFNRQAANENRPARRGAAEWGTNPCLTGDSWVLTADGPRQIRELVDRPHQTLVNGKSYWTTADGFWSNGKKPILRLATKEGYTLRLTANHPLLAVTHRSRKTEKSAWRLAGELKPGDEIKLHNHRDASWAGEGTFEEGWLLGSLIGDGTFSEKVGSEAQPLVMAHLDYWGNQSGHMAEVALGRLTSSVKTRSDLRGLQYEGKHRIQSAGLATLASHYGITSGQKTVTPAVERTSFNFHVGFLQGLFDADGSVQGHQLKGVSVRLAQSNLATLQGVQRMLLRLGIVSTLYPNRRPAGKRNLPDGKGGSQAYDCRADHELVIASENIKLFAERVGFSEPMKSARLTDSLGAYKRVLNRETFTVTVATIEVDGEEEVYDCSVPNINAFDANGFYVHNCGEIILRPWELCNLSVAVARPHDDYDSLRNKVEIATLIGTIQSMATHFPGLRPMWKANCEEERLLGVDINGQLDSAVAQDAGVQRRLREVAIEVNRQTADALGINRSASITCVKPSGNSSQLLNCSPGIHSRWSPYYVRNVRVGTHTPIYKVLRDTGVPMDPENGQTPDNADTYVIHFPVKAPDGAITRKDRSALEQCDYWLQNKVFYTEHNPSVTITYQPDEVLDIIKWVWKHQNIIGGMTFLPAFDAQYDQMPYMEISEEEYGRLAGRFPEIDFSKIYRYEEEDLTTAAQELACLAGNCDI